MSFEISLGSWGFRKLGRTVVAWSSRNSVGERNFTWHCSEEIMVEFSILNKLLLQSDDDKGAKALIRTGLIWYPSHCVGHLSFKSGICMSIIQQAVTIVNLFLPISGFFSSQWAWDQISLWQLNKAHIVPVLIWDQHISFFQIPANLCQLFCLTWKNRSKLLFVAYDVANDA